MTTLFQFQSVGPVSVNGSTEDINVPFSVDTPAGWVVPYLMTMGDNTISTPAGEASFVIIQPPSTNVGTLTLKGAGGDTGIVIHPTLPTILSLGPADTFFILKTTAIITITLIYM